MEAATEEFLDRVVTVVEYAFVSLIRKKMIC